MIKLTALVVLIFSVTAFASSPIEMAIEAKEFFSQKKNQSMSIKEGMSYVKVLRNEIINLG